MFIENVQRFATVTHLVEGLSLRVLVTQRMETAVICLAGTRRPIGTVTAWNNALQNVNYSTWIHN
jgi:hypothetical protein